VYRDRHRVAIVLAQGANIVDLHRIRDQVGISEGRQTGNDLSADGSQFGRKGTRPHSGGAGTFAGRAVDLSVHKEHIAQVDDPQQQHQQQGKHQGKLNEALRPVP